MTAYLLTGWDVARIGNIAVKVTDAGGTVEFQYTSGQRALRDLSSVVSAYTAFPDELETDLNASATLSLTYTVAWSAATGITISSTDTFSLTFSTTSTPAEGTRMRQILGMSGDRSGASTYSSQVTPYYYLALTKAGPSGYSRPFYPSGQTKRVVSSNGSAYGVRPTTRERRVKFGIKAQSLATTFVDEATSSVPWTYEALLDHVGVWEPVLLSYGAPEETAIFKMVDPEFSAEARKSAFDDYHDGGWHLTIEGQYLGAL